MNNDLLKYFNAFLNTPSLWKENTFNIEQFKIPEINLSTFLPTYIPENIRLGHQIEHLFLQLLKHAKNYTVLIQNLPIRNMKI